MTVYAAGAVCWRIIEGKLRILVIHRTQHKDISLPKGKVDPGETLPQTAVREIHEETGLKVSLGVPLGVSYYELSGGRDKEVHYWAAEVTEAAVKDSEFVPNSEVEALEWVSVKQARKRLSYALDVTILDRFDSLYRDGVKQTYAIIALRHGKAESKSTSSADRKRALTGTGRSQAAEAAISLQSWSPRSIVSSDAVRCVQTVQPLSLSTGLSVSETADLSQDSFAAGSADVRSVVGRRVRKRETAVLCSHGPVLPEILREIGLATGSTATAALAEAAMLPVGAFSVVHLSVDHPGAGVIAIETHVPQH